MMKLNLLKTEIQVYYSINPEEQGDIQKNTSSTGLLQLKTQRGNNFLPTALLYVSV